MFINSLGIKTFAPLFKGVSQPKGPKLQTLTRDEVHFKGAEKEPTGFEIKGKYTSAFVFSNDIDYKASAQIRACCNHPVFKDAQIRIMPDVHAGKANVVGFCAKMKDDTAFIPSIIGGDIGCGMLCTKIDTNGEPLDFKKLDEVISTYISGKSPKNIKFKNIPKDFEKRLSEVTKKTAGKRADSFEADLGLLGGGNHFIEIDKNKKGELYLVIHSGSKNLGQSVGNYYQELAEKTNPYSIKEMSYLTGESAKEYFEATKLAKEYAQLNRKVIADIIMNKMGWSSQGNFESVHNYISDDATVRKGAISAQEGEDLIIPINMKDGAIIAKGKGNENWNSTAPHGAGRKFSRSDAKGRIALGDYQKTMSGIHSSCISEKTLSESPQAYRSVSEIADVIGDTAQIEEFISPIYNFKG